MKKKILSGTFWIAVWYGVSLLVRNSILLADPVDVLRSLIRLGGTSAFWTSLGHSFLQVSCGILIGTLLAILSAVLCCRHAWLRMLTEPLVHVLKAVPVVSYIIMAMIWAGTARLSAVISAIVVFPLMWLSTVSGIESADGTLNELASVFNIPPENRLRYIWLPQMSPFLRSGLAMAIGMGWKSGVAAEVIGQPQMTLGNGMYRAKILLETGDVLAWTAVIVLVSWLTEKLVLLLLSRITPNGWRDSGAH